MKQSFLFYLVISFSPLLLWSSTAHSHHSQPTIQFLLHLPPTIKQKKCIHRYHGFFYQFLEVLEYCDALLGKALIMGYFVPPYSTTDLHPTRLPLHVSLTSPNLSPNLKQGSSALSVRSTKHLSNKISLSQSRHIHQSLTSIKTATLHSWPALSSPPSPSP